MKKITRGFYCSILLLSFAIFAHAQSVWTGTYKFGEDGGKTADGFISEVEILDSLSDGLLRQAVFNLIQMKFIPAGKNGVIIRRCNLVF